MVPHSTYPDKDMMGREEWGWIKSLRHFQWCSTFFWDLAFPKFLGCTSTSTLVAGIGKGWCASHCDVAIDGRGGPAPARTSRLHLDWAHLADRFLAGKSHFYSSTCVFRCTRRQPDPTNWFCSLGFKNSSWAMVALSWKTFQNSCSFFVP